MAKLEMRVIGLEKLSQKLSAISKMEEVKRIVKSNGGKLDRTMKAKATFRGHFEGKRFVKPTGATKRSITLSMEDGGLSAKVGPTTHYAIYLEKGTRKMSAQPFVKPAFDEVKGQFKKDLEGLFK